MATKTELPHLTDADRALAQMAARYSPLTVPLQHTVLDRQGRICAQTLAGDAGWIAEVCNAMPGLLRRLEEALAENARLKEDSELLDELNRLRLVELVDDEGNVFAGGWGPQDRPDFRALVRRMKGEREQREEIRP